jgi:rhodanese-related sulfurtransferase
MEVACAARLAAPHRAPRARGRAQSSSTARSALRPGRRALHVAAAASQVRSLRSRTAPRPPRRRRRHAAPVPRSAPRLLTQIRNCTQCWHQDDKNAAAQCYREVGAVAAVIVLQTLAAQVRCVRCWLPRVLQCLPATTRPTHTCDRERTTPLACARQDALADSSLAARVAPAESGAVRSGAAAAAKSGSSYAPAVAPELVFQLAADADAPAKAANPREAIRAAARAKALAQSQGASTNKVEEASRPAAPMPAAAPAPTPAPAVQPTPAPAVPAATPAAAPKSPASVAPSRAAATRRPATPPTPTPTPASPKAPSAPASASAAPPAASQAMAPTPPVMAVAVKRETVTAPAEPSATPTTPQAALVGAPPAAADVKAKESSSAFAAAANGAAKTLQSLPSPAGSADLVKAQASAAAASAAASAEAAKAAVAAAALGAGAVSAAGSAASGVASALGGAASDAGASVAAASASINAALAAVSASLDAATTAAGAATASQIASFTAAAASVLPPPVADALNALARDNVLLGRVTSTVLGGSVLLAIAVRQALYGGYAGDLSPRAVEAVLYKEARAFIVDVRSAAAREAAGVPDLRKQARSKAVVVEVEPLPAALRGSVRGARELELERVALRVRGATPPAGRVVLMDAGGGEARELARALTKIGGRRAYTLSGGFPGWTAAGLRVKRDYTSSPLAAVTEDLEVLTAEVAATTQAAASDVVSDPVRLTGYAAAAVGVLVAATQWELVLQEVGVLGVMASTARWLLSYQSLEELAADVASGAGQAASAAKGSAEFLSAKLPKKA